MKLVKDRFTGQDCCLSQVGQEREAQILLRPKDFKLFFTEFKDKFNHSILHTLRQECK